MGIYEFMAGSPIITLCIVYMLTVTPLRMWKAWMRTRNIRSAGWPRPILMLMVILSQRKKKSLDK